MVAVVIVVALAAVAAFVIWGGDDEDTTTTGASTTTERSTTTTSSTTTTTTTTSGSTTTTAASGSLPGAAAVVTAGPGGGSGEVEVNWDAAAGATGYRVLRAGVVEGPFEIVADLDITTGSTTAEAEVVNIWSAQHSYVPSGGPLAARDTSLRFQYVEVTAGERCFRVVAYNAAGDGPASVVACGSPP